MLPEFLFSVTNSMPESSRDDLGLLNGVTNENSIKDMCPPVQGIDISNSNSPSPPPISLTTLLNSTTKTAQPLNTFAESLILSNNSLRAEDHNSQSPHGLYDAHSITATTISSTWQQHAVNSHHHNQNYLRSSINKKLLLQNSDDPLICSGANDINDHPAEINSLIAAVNIGRHHVHQQNSNSQLRSQLQARLQSQASLGSTAVSLTSNNRQATEKTHFNINKPAVKVTNGCSSLTKQQLKLKAGLMSAQNQQIKNQSNVTSQISTTKFNARATKPKKKKGELKLRFHHQALPPEYLSHYEATQGCNRERGGGGPTTKPDTVANAESGKPAQPSKLKLPPQKSAHENVRSWLQKIAEIQRTADHQKNLQSQETSNVSEILSLHLCNVATGAVKNSIKYDANNNRPKDLQEALQQPTLNATQIKLKDTHLSFQQQHHSSNINKCISTAATTSTSIVSTMVTNGTESAAATKCKPGSNMTLPSKRMVNYADLPFMGEITLNNLKPRRGRKPKKADICHLIYKNYGTILPGTPKDVFESSAAEILKSQHVKNIQVTVNNEEEPLNLCLRDQCNDSYSVSSSSEDEDALTEVKSEATAHSNCPTPATSVATPQDAVTDVLLAANMKSSLSSLSETEGFEKTETKMEPISSSTSTATTPENLLLQPVSMYYQKLIESGILQQCNGHAPFGLPIETIQKDNQIALKIPIPKGLFLQRKLEKLSASPLPNQGNSNNNNNILEYPEPMSTPSSIKSENSYATTATSSSTTAATQHQPQQLSQQQKQQLQQQQHHHVLPSTAAVQKRKRSAIFIPPIPTEHSNTPPTEVSICKFKFTGGAKPTLQEKKMLSVDAEGNYRYYNGTGDKSMRGYEFFPRECLLPTAHQNSDKPLLILDIPPPSADLSNELLQIPDSPTSALLLPSTTSSTPTTPQTPGSSSPYLNPNGSVAIHNGVEAGGFHAEVAVSNFKQTKLEGMWQASTSQATVPTIPQRTDSERSSKKKSRRSVQREKLEKTFKEKGFLIQTQQLQSAEGATYCKFRQLKKFTRYLFRNWKDYLPEECVQQKGANSATVQHQQMAALLASHGIVSDQLQLTEINNDKESRSIGLAAEKMN